jgi:hypothetical protein|tara:strand:+ start:7865 stop:8074 length:210 start_codon:yes stop_codon:yes gene_type:complete
MIIHLLGGYLDGSITSTEDHLEQYHYHNTELNSMHIYTLVTAADEVLCFPETEYLGTPFLCREIKRIDP